MSLAFIQKSENAQLALHNLNKNTFRTRPFSLYIEPEAFRNIQTDSCCVLYFLCKIEDNN